MNALIRTCLLAGAIGLTVALVMTTLGLSLWLVLVTGLAIPVIGAWLTVCDTLEANEDALDALLDARAATALRGQTKRAYTGKTVKLNEVRR